MILCFKLWYYFRFLWPCIMNIRWRERTNKMQLIRCLLSNFLSQHVLGIIMPISRRIRPCLTACGVLLGYVGCGWQWSCGAASWAVCTVWKLLLDNSNFHTVHTAHSAAPQDHSQPQPTHPGRTPHAVGHDFILLMMGIMMPKTCWDRKFDNKHQISCILLVLSLHLMWYYCWNIKEDSYPPPDFWIFSIYPVIALSKGASMQQSCVLSQKSIQFMHNKFVS